MRHRPQLTSPKLSDGNLFHAADFWTWSSGYGERETTPRGVIWPELQKARSWRSRAFANFDGRALYADSTPMAQISTDQQ